MKTTLTGSWELSDEHAASSDGQPVLVHRPTGDAYGPGDVVQGYGPLGRMVAATAVYRLAPAAELTVAQQALGAQFVGVLPT